MRRDAMQYGWIGKIKLISLIKILWGLIPDKTANPCDDFCLPPHLKIKIAMQD
jgi:hypothetical protein